uniref:Uncharacterized protein n=1 Tax=Romanomermis culicivorax TaxID=13658 RepID=A0A915L550_ROMCU
MKNTLGEKPFGGGYLLEKKLETRKIFCTWFSFNEKKSGTKIVIQLVCFGNLKSQNPTHCATALLPVDRFLTYSQEQYRVLIQFGPSSSLASTAGVYICNPMTTYSTGQFNIEIPPILPKRSSESYADDPPLTTMGEMCAQLLGNRFAELGLTFDLVYSSPSERCVVTCYRILEGYQDFLGDCDLKIRVDGGLYEWGSLSKGAVNFEEPLFYTSRGISCDMKYKNSIEQEDLKHHAWETYEDFCKRANDWLKKITRDVRKGRSDRIEV